MVAGPRAVGEAEHPFAHLCTAEVIQVRVLQVPVNSPLAQGKQAKGSLLFSESKVMERTKKM